MDTCIDRRNARCLRHIATASFAVATASPTAGVILGSLLGFALFVAMVWVSATGVQRLHDLGWSGWLYLLNLVPLVNSIFPLLLVLPGNAGANQYGAPPPRNSTAVKVLASLWLAFIPLMLIIVMTLGMNGYLNQLEANVDSSYESSSLNADQDVDQSVIVEEEDAQSADDAAEPVDSPEQQKRLPPVMHLSPAPRRCDGERHDPLRSDHRRLQRHRPGPGRSPGPTRPQLDSGGPPA
jgi:uncharacterized membrane protein YhaH (DUF805 family)